VTTAPASPTPPPELARLRGSIDNIDAALIHLLAERFKATQQVGVLKARLGLPASDPGREAQQVGRLRSLAHDADLDPVFAEKFLAFIVEEVIRHHEAIAAGPDGQGAATDADGTPAGA
jgi:chorismate mutase